MNIGFAIIFLSWTFATVNCGQSCAIKPCQPKHCSHSCAPPNRPPRPTKAQEHAFYDRYDCGSYITQLSSRQTFPIPDFRCNDKLVGPEDYEVSVVTRDGEALILRVRGLFSLIDNNGVQTFNALGQVVGSECDGAYVHVYNQDKIAEGSCDCDEGVTRTKTTCAIVVIKGVCDSVLYGSSNVTYSPGIRC